MKSGFYLLMILLLFACEPAENSGPPKEAELLAPKKDELCLTGSVVSATESIVKFQWRGASTTRSYELHITDLESRDSRIIETEKSNAEVQLKVNSPFSWYVISKTDENAQTSKSPVWKFYNSGLGLVSYAPFPAELLAPGLDEIINVSSSPVRLSWSGFDVDADINYYDVYFGNSAIPPLYKTNVKDKFLEVGNMNPSGTYFWKVTTVDAKGNTSSSMVYYFKIK